MFSDTLAYIARVAHSIGTVSAHIPDELEGELAAYVEEEGFDRSTAIRKLLAEGLDEWRRERALEQLRAGEMAFSRAAELVDMTVWDFAELVRERDGAGVGEDGVDADLEAL